jgi:hypothetical protein
LNERIGPGDSIIEESLRATPQPAAVVFAVDFTSGSSCGDDDEEGHCGVLHEGLTVKSVKMIAATCRRSR